MPEIADGIVEIKACAREPGHRTKIAVWSNDHNVDPVGACVGARGGRVRMVVNELRGEKIDIVPFSEDLTDFVAKALSPAKVKQVIVVRRRHAGRRHRARLPAQPGDRQGGPERPPRRPAHRRAHRHQARDASSPRAFRPAARSSTRASSTPRASGSQNAETGEMEWHAADGTVISEAEWNAQAAADATVADAEVASDDAVDDEAEADAADAPAGRRRRERRRRQHR